MIGLCFNRDRTGFKLGDGVVGVYLNDEFVCDISTVQGGLRPQPARRRDGRLSSAMADTALDHECERGALNISRQQRRSRARRVEKDIRKAERARRLRRRRRRAKMARKVAEVSASSAEVDGGAHG